MWLIDADKALEQINEWLDQTGAIPLNTSYHFELLGCIEDCPTIDAVPVVRGYSYEDDKTYSGPGTSNYICSVCGEMQGTWKKGLAQNQKFKFCPWCGAKMEGKPCG